MAMLAIVLLAIGGGAVAWDRHTLRGSQDTLSVLLVLGRHGEGQATVSVRRGRLADPGPFAERVAALLTPTTHRSPTRIYTDLLDRHQMIDVPLAQLMAPLRLDTQALQQALAAAGFLRRLVVGLYSEEHWQVVPGSAARAGDLLGQGAVVRVAACHRWATAQGRGPSGLSQCSGPSVTIARFRVRHQTTFAGFLVASLELCAAGMVRRAVETDQRENWLFGDARGDELARRHEQRTLNLKLSSRFSLTGLSLNSGLSVVVTGRWWPPADAEHRRPALVKRRRSS
jgi:hypothetical protein